MTSVTIVSIIIILIYILTSRVRSTTEGNVFSLSLPSLWSHVPSGGGGGVLVLSLVLSKVLFQVLLGGGGSIPQSGQDRGNPRPPPSPDRRLSKLTPREVRRTLLAVTQEDFLVVSFSFSASDLTINCNSLICM